MVRILYQHFANITKEYIYVDDNDVYIFYKAKDSVGKPNKLRKDNLNKGIGYGGVWSFNDYNDEIETTLKGYIKTIAQSRAMKIETLQSQLDSMREIVDECNYFIENGRS